MTEKGLIVLKRIIAQFGSKSIDIVVGSRDKNVENDYYEFIRELCEKNDILFADRKEKPIITSKFSFAISWQWLINTPTDKELIVFHDSLLPKYRGFAPLVNSIINGDEEIGVTALFAAKDYDKGDIIYQSGTKVEYPMKISRAIQINNENYVACAFYVLDLISKDEVIPRQKQLETGATYSLWRNDEDYQIAWSQSADEIKRFIDATGKPYKSAFTIAEGKKIRVTDVEIVEDLHIINRNPGKFISVEQGMPVVVCGKGLLKIIQAYYEETKNNFLPIKKFRTRLK